MRGSSRTENERPSLSSSCLTSLPHLAPLLAHDYRCDSEHRRLEVAFHTPRLLAWRPPILMPRYVSPARFSATGVLRSLSSRRCGGKKVQVSLVLSLALSPESVLARYSVVHVVWPKRSRCSGPRVLTSLLFGFHAALKSTRRSRELPDTHLSAP